MNRTVGVGGVSGTITTDGTIGVLGESDIVSFDLTIKGVALSIELMSPGDGAFVGGTGLTATSSDIFFDFGNSASFVLFQTSFGNGSRYYGDAGASAGLLLPGESVNPGFVEDSNFINVAQSGNQILATATSAVPEPSSILILGSGMAGIAVLVKRWLRLQTL